MKQSLLSQLLAIVGIIDKFNTFNPVQRNSKHKKVSRGSTKSYLKRKRMRKIQSASRRGIYLH